MYLHTEVRGKQDSANSHPSRDHGNPIGAVLGRIPSGLFILTAGGGAGCETGLLASWVQQASFEPPMILVALNRKRYLNEWLEKHPRLAVNLVGESQRALLKHFAAGFKPDQPAFEGLDITRGVTGLPVLRDALGYLEGTIECWLRCGDHVVYAVKIIAAGAHDSLLHERPMVHIRKSGFSY